MTLTFPRDMPSLGETQAFELDAADFSSREAGGRTGALRVGEPLWRMEFDIGIGQIPAAHAARAFITSCQGAGRLFYAWDLTRSLPYAYMLTGLPGGWDGECDSWSQSVSDGIASLTVTGLPAGLTITACDYVSLQWETEGAQRRALVRFSEGGAASGGGSFTGAIDPAIPALVPVDATAMMARPDCLMRLDPERTSIGRKDHFGRAPVTIAGLQVLLP